MYPTLFVFAVHTHTPSLSHFLPPSGPLPFTLSVSLLPPLPGGRTLVSGSLASGITGPDLPRPFWRHRVPSGLLRATLLLISSAPRPAPLPAYQHQRLPLPQTQIGPHRPDLRGRWYAPAADGRDVSILFVKTIPPPCPPQRHPAATLHPHLRRHGSCTLNP